VIIKKQTTVKTDMTIRLTNHAGIKMAQRGITLEEMKNTVLNPKEHGER